jgi:adenylate cyclase class 1
MKKKRPTDIQSLFLMGSTGSIAHGGGSDFDVWLCHRSNLEAAGRDELQQKCARVSQWAQEQGVELHVFLIDPAEFRQLRKQAEAGQEDCGTSQHYLLLDEFYRTNIWLAGAYPLWWIIPPEHEHRFNDVARTLVQKRFIRSRDYLDFGGCPAIPPGEYVGAGMWQLYKGVDAPYKSVLKLMLIETYAADPEAGPNLSLSFKQAVFDDRIDFEELDPYMMVYRRLEHSLQRRQVPERLMLARKSFYLKVGERLSQAQIQKDKSWRRLLMERLVAEWGWTVAEQRYLDQRARWKVSEVIQERRVVVAELTGCYRFLSGYARDHQLASSISARDLNLLGRKLYAAFQRKAGKLDLVNPGIAPDIAEDSLAFHHASAPGEPVGSSGWSLYRHTLVSMEEPLPPPLRRSASLFELLAWSHINQILVPGTTLNLSPGDSQARLYELHQLQHVLQQTLSVPLPPVAQETYQGRAQIRQVIFALNVAVDPMQELSSRGLAKISDKTDALGYADEKTNLVMQVDLLLLNSWNEVLVQHFETGDTLIQALKSWLAGLAAGQQWGESLPDSQICCFCATRAPYIAERVRLLLAELVNAFFVQPAVSTSRYILQIDERFFVLQFVNGQPRFAGMDSAEALIEFLGQPQPYFSGLIVDSFALAGHPLVVMARELRPGALQVFYRTFGLELEIFLSDERGSISYLLVECEHPEEYLAAFVRFLQAILDRKQMHDVLADDEEAVIEIEFYRLRQTLRGLVADADVIVDPIPSEVPEIQVIGEHVEDDVLTYRLFLDQQEIIWKTSEEALMTEVAVALRQRFRAGTRPRAYITDLSLPGGWQDDKGFGHRQTLHYLRYRRDIEAALQRSIG